MFPPTADKDRYYFHAAKRFMLDAQMLRCRATIHVEDKDDIVFWSTIFAHLRPRDRFHFIAGSRNERGNETKGVTQCLKYLKHLGPKFFICIDSDYRYLLQERNIDIKHFVFQTYTYSFENHHCYSRGLNDVCLQVTNLPNLIFDFQKFIQQYSRIVYELFLWHLYFLRRDSKCFPISEFNQLITLPGKGGHPDIRDNARIPLRDLQKRVKAKLNALRRKYPRTDIHLLEEKYAKLGLHPDTTYFFLRGHNLYDMIHALTKEVCKKVLRHAKENNHGPHMYINLFQFRNSIDAQLKQRFHFGAYPAIRKIEKDIETFFG